MGLPGSGKSTLIARLLKLAEVEEMLKAHASTGIMEGIVTVNVAEDKTTFHPTDIVSGYKLGESRIWYQLPQANGGRGLCCVHLIAT